jgi:hypothetical protein
MAFRIVERSARIVAIYVHSKTNPTQSEFDDACSQLVALRKRVPRALSRLRIVVLSDGGGPNIFQRTQHSFDALDNAKVPTSLVSCALSSSIARGIVNAVMWLNPAFKAFSPSQWRLAVEYVGLANDPDLLDDIILTAQQLSRPVKTLDMIEIAMRMPSAYGNASI